MKTELDILNEVFGKNTYGTLDTQSLVTPRTIMKCMTKFAEQFKPKDESKDIEERRIKFFQKVGEQFLQKYEKQMLRDFCDYWTEHNDGGNKMRFEMKKNQPFNLSRRLGTWYSNNQNKGFISKKSKIHTNDDIMDAIKNQG